MAAPIQPTTMGLSTTDWFNNQGMSLTSRSVEQGFGIFSGDEDELEHGGSWAFIKCYVATAGSRSYAQQSDEEEKKEEDEQQEKKEEDGKDNDHADILMTNFPCTPLTLTISSMTTQTTLMKSWIIC
jgi:hypothetical protein